LLRQLLISGETSLVVSLRKAQVIATLLKGQEGSITFQYLKRRRGLITFQFLRSGAWIHHAVTLVVVTMRHNTSGQVTVAIWICFLVIPVLLATLHGNGEGRWILAFFSSSLPSLL